MGELQSLLKVVEVQESEAATKNSKILKVNKNKMIAEISSSLNNILNTLNRCIKDGTSPTQ